VRRESARRAGDSDHPLVRQTIRTGLEEAMDIEGFEQLLRVWSLAGSKLSLAM